MRLTVIVIQTVRDMFTAMEILMNCPPLTLCLWCGVRVKHSKWYENGDFYCQNGR